VSLGLRHQTEAQYSAVEKNRAKVAVHNVVFQANRSQQAASRVRCVLSAFCEVTRARGVGDTHWRS